MSIQVGLGTVEMDNKGLGIVASTPSSEKRNYLEVSVVSTRSPIGSKDGTPGDKKTLT